MFKPALRAVAALFVILSALQLAADCPSILLTPQQTRADGSWVNHDLQSVDYDNDGKLDLVGLIDQTNVGGSGTIYAWKGNGDGTFAAPVSLGTTDVSELLVADLNNDGKLDLIALGMNGIATRLGNGSGFNSAVALNVPAGATHGVAVLIDGDAFKDLVITSVGYSEIIIFHGVGDGTFTQTRVISSNTSSAWAIAAADFDADGRVDIAYSHLGDPSLDVIFRNSDGSYTAPVTFQGSDAAVSPYSNYPNVIATADVNEDGKPDLVIGNNEDAGAVDSVTILMNGGSRTFSRSTLSPALFHASGSIYSTRVADLNNDGHLDIITGSVNGGYVLTYAGKGDGTFFSPTYFTNSPGMFASIALGDFDGDNDLDAAFGSFQQIATAKSSCGTGVILYSKSPVVSSGQSAPLRAIVSGIGASTPLPRGTVTFKEGMSVIGMADVDAHGNAAFDASGLSVATHTITAEFGGNSVEGSATSSSITQRVVSTTTTTMIAAGASVYGSPTVLTITIKSATNQTIYGYYILNVDGVESERWSGATASLQLAPGTHSITASFEGDSSYPPSTSGTQMITTSKATPSIANTSGVLTVRLGIQHILGFSLTGPNGFAGPTGTLQLKRGSNILASGTLSNGAITLGATLQRGATDVTAVFLGDSNFNSVSMPLTLSVLPNDPLSIDARGLQSSISIRCVLPDNVTSTSLYRSLSGANTWTLVTGWTPNGEYDNTNPTRGVLYDYKLTVVSAGVEQTSNIDSAILFTDDPLAAQSTIVKRIHFNELRLAVNALRSVAGLQPFSFDSSYNALIVNASHLASLRTAVTEARQALGMYSATYTDNATSGTTIKAVHVQELRDLAR